MYPACIITARARFREIKKVFILLLAVICLAAANAQAVVITGSGTTREEAIENGLRDAVEMYTGTLVYGVTDVENYTLQKDQIVASSLGYVKQYRIIRTSRVDDLIHVVMDVTLSEDKIDRILRDNVDLMTVEDVLRDYNNVTQRQDQMKKLMAMLKILSDRPLSERYSIIYTGYEIKRIMPDKVNVEIHAKLYANPFFMRANREILRHLSDPTGYSRDVWQIGTNYRIESGKLKSDTYFITRQAKVRDELKVYVTINDEKVGDKFYRLRDNLLVVLDPVAFTRAFVQLFPKAVWARYNDREAKIDEKWDKYAIRKSKIIPEDGLPMKFKYTIDSEQVKDLRDLNLKLEYYEEK
ncbi:MAG: hypothetical protein QM278_08450 [Pseudomonadota bacterium]|nr:hypothetical protein [Pseudomonadota bacterium]